MKQVQLYNELVRCYNRSRRKLQRFSIEGKNLRKQNILQRRIARLFKTLTGLRRSLKLVMATAALSAGILLFQPNAVQAQITFGAAQTNPFGLTGTGFNSYPTFADLDGDGDMDMISGDGGDLFLYFQNIGSSTAPNFAVAQPDPFGLSNSADAFSPAFADVDGDGDIDLMAGHLYGNFFYFQNTGTATSPAFAAAQTNPFGLTDIGARSSPTFADLDEDGDMDLMCGEYDGNFFYFQNTGTVIAPAFATALTNPLGLTNIGPRPSPTFGDLDGDGDLDMMGGDFYSTFSYFQNIGTPTNPAFAALLTNPYGLTDVVNGRPVFVDLDADGDLDMMAGEWSGNFYYFENTTSCNGITVYADADGDSYGDAANSLFVADCIIPTGYV